MQRLIKQNSTQFLVAPPGSVLDRTPFVCNYTCKFSEICLYQLWVSFIKLLHDIKISGDLNVVDESDSAGWKDAPTQHYLMCPGKIKSPVMLVI